jgi:hypothetical protein
MIAPSARRRHRIFGIASALKAELIAPGIFARLARRASAASAQGDDRNEIACCQPLDTLAKRNHFARKFMAEHRTRACGKDRVFGHMEV